MQTAISKTILIAKEIESNFIYDYTDRLKELDLWRAFEPVYNIHGVTTKNKNIAICFICHAYNPESMWLDIKKDRSDNKRSILLNLGANFDDEFTNSLLINENEQVVASIFRFLENIKDWRWRTIFDLIEYSSKMSRFAAMDTADEKSFKKTTKDGTVEDYSQEVEIETIVKVNKEKGNLISLAFDARKKADELIEQIQKDYVATDNATQNDFNFTFTETAKKRDPLSWREYIKSRAK